MEKETIRPKFILLAPEDIMAVADAVQNQIKASENMKAGNNSNKDNKKIKNGIQNLGFTAKTLRDTIKDAKDRNITLDIALFGRMVTSSAFADVEASIQVPTRFPLTGFGWSLIFSPRWMI